MYCGPVRKVRPKADADRGYARQLSGSISHLGKPRLENQVNSQLTQGSKIYCGLVRKSWPEAYADRGDARQLSESILQLKRPSSETQITLTTDTSV